MTKAHNITAKDEGFKKDREKAEKRGDVYQEGEDDDTDMEDLDEYEEDMET